MGYVLYGDKGTGAFCVEAALAEAGAEYEFKIISLEKNEQREPAYLVINPSGKLPALKLPSGEIITESSGLMLVVADRHPEANLLPPSDTDARAQALRWITFMASEIYPMVEISDYPERFVPAGKEAEALKTKVQERIRERLLVIEKNAAGPWILKSGFSLVDIYAVMFTRWRNTVGKAWLASGHVDRINAIAMALKARPRIAPIWSRHFWND